jgi:hypothetical protein
VIEALRTPDHYGRVSSKWLRIEYLTARSPPSLTLPFFRRPRARATQTRESDLLMRLSSGRYMSPETVELCRNTCLNFKETFVSTRQKRKEKTDKILGILHVAPRPRAPVKVA